MTIRLKGLMFLLTIGALLWALSAKAQPPHARNRVIDRFGGPEVQIISPVEQVVTGDQRTLVILTNFSDVSVQCPVSQVNEIMFGAINSVADVYRETSHGMISFSGDTVGPFTLSHASNTCQLSEWADEADALAGGFDPSAYDRKVYVMPQNGCGAAGVGEVGGINSRAWVFTCHLPGVYAHELGHNLSMMHASTPTNEYGDFSDFMAAVTPLIQVNAPHKAQMGWKPKTTIAQSGTYDIAPLELDAGLAPQILTLPLTEGPIEERDEELFLSYRLPIGYDASLTGNFANKVNIHRHYLGDLPINTYFLAALRAGEVFEIEDHRIEVTSITPDYATVNVTTANAPPEPPEPPEPPPGDTDPPTTPIISADPKPKHIKLVWTASTDNVGVAGYRLYANDVLILQTTDLGYMDKFVSGGYEYSVEAFDSAGNVSGRSSVSAQLKAKGSM